VDEHRIVIVGIHWRERHSELAYVTRSIAAAASRWASVSVLVPGAPAREPDGAFELHGLGGHGGWVWPPGLARDCVVVVDDPTAETAALLAQIGPRAVFCLSSPAQGQGAIWPRLPLTGDLAANRPFVNLYVPVNPSAGLHRHNGFGFTGYQLVLSDRSGVHDDPPPAVAWLTAAFHDGHVIVVEQAVASAWKGRALRGTVSVDTRMDLWRLIAHANVCIDLAPGPQIARECVEALRFGTPIVVPSDSGPAVVHATAGGGATFGDPEELLRAAAVTQSADVRTAMAGLGRRYADATYGAPSKFTESLQGVLTHARK
jgi:hypothetical protein